MEQVASRDMIRRNALFATVADPVIDGFVTACQRQTLQKGDTLFLQGSRVEWFYLIISGWVKIFRETADGQEAVIDMLTTGQMFGETALFEGDIHSTGATVVEQAILLRLPINLLKNAITDDRDMALAMLQSLSNHRKRQTHEIESLTVQNASQRIGCFLLRLCDQNAEGEIDICLPYDKSLIAARLGMKAETFSRALNKLRDETSIMVEGSRVVIPHLENLSHFACSACSNEFPCDDLH